MYQVFLLLELLAEYLDLREPRLDPRRRLDQGKLLFLQQRRPKLQLSMAVLDQVLGSPDLFQAAFVSLLGLCDAFQSIC